MYTFMCVTPKLKDEVVIMLRITNYYFRMLRYSLLLSCLLQTF